MSSVNQIITDTLKQMISADPEIPKQLEDLFIKLFTIESVSGSQTGGIQKLYEQTIEQFYKDEQFLEWCKRNAKSK